MKRCLFIFYAYLFAIFYVKQIFTKIPENYICISEYEIYLNLFDIGAQICPALPYPAILEVHPDKGS